MSRVHANNYPTGRRTYLGTSHAAKPTLAWQQRSQTQAREGYHVVPQDTGSRIIISQLPSDVSEVDIEELLGSTIGPLHDLFMICNSKGQSKGMAIAHFKRQSDARNARTRYHGKIIDGRRPIQVDLINDNESYNSNGVASTSQPIPQPIPRAPRALTLKERLGAPIQNRNTRFPPINVSPMANGAAPRQIPTAPQQTRSQRMKKGPRRAKKRPDGAIMGGGGQSQPKSVEDLDKEMDEYRRTAKFA